MENIIENLDPVVRMSRDINSASKILSEQEARFLVDSYYSMQESRKRSANQVRALNESEEPNDVLAWLLQQNETLEKQVARSLKTFAEAHPIASWAMSVKGVGPVISAGLIAHIDINKAPTVGHIWSFAGLNPNQEWKKGQKRPWNAQLKTLCWKIGESFVKVMNRGSFYGNLFQKRKEYEQAKNENGDYREIALARAETVGKTTEAYKYYSIGKLPPGHIHARAKRYAVKLFLAHLHEVWYRHEFGKQPPKPYIFEHGDGEHVHLITPEDVYAFENDQEKVA